MKIESFLLRVKAGGKIKDNEMKIGHVANIVGIF